MMRRDRWLAIALTALLSAGQIRAQESTIEEVIVTSSPLRESPLQIAQPTEVLSGDELRRRIAGSLGETLSSEPGVTSTYFGPTASRPIIRGLGGYRVQTLQDGLASLDVAGLSQDHAVTLESIISNQIEIIKGPAALLYGSGAAGGLVNVVTNRVPVSLPKRAVTGAVELRASTAEGERAGAASVDGAVDKFAMHADYFKRETEDVQIPGFAQSDRLRRALVAAGQEPDNVRGRIPNSESHTYGGAVGGSYVGDKLLGGLCWSRYNSNYGIPGEQSAFIDMNQDRIDAKGAWYPQGRLTAVHLNGSYNDYRHTEFEAVGEPGTVFSQTAYETRLTADNQIGKGWRGSTGVQYVHIDFAAIGKEAFVPSSVTRAASLFAFEERHFDKWTIELGARAEHQTIDVDHASNLPNYNGTAVSFSAGAVWKFTAADALALNVTRTQRNPQAGELYANPSVPHVAAQRFEAGDPNLGRETAITTDLTLRRTGEGIRWAASMFYYDYSSFIFENPTGIFVATETGELFQVFDYRQAGAKLYGFEAEAEFPFWNRGERSLELRLASDYVRGTLNNDGNLPQIPPLRIGAGLHYDDGALHVGVQVYFYDKQDKIAEHELPTDGYTMLDADASYRLSVGIGSVFIFLRGSNLLDEDARQHSSPLKDIAPLPGRSLHLGARLEF